MIAAGRDGERLAILPRFGADETVSLEGDPAEVAGRLGEAAADVDVVLDYVWGAATAQGDPRDRHQSNRSRQAPQLDRDRLGRRADRGDSLRRPPSRPVAAGGSGQGSVPTRDIVSELPALAAEIGGGAFTINVRPVPLADVEAAWTTREHNDERIVITP
ncbi:MAG: hypothetical protein WDM88_03075 [Galbitalea sp.]